ncbi:unnamed protein product [Ambrosiozyma monospora]|uniref:Unnamed protein product n=1 Tax=Ambrosiozyma monospora TaxID=43982 RepID=A0ACB5TC87_AMBMO|nr:unnamed protein product [Ambrosiozyma monospora]
MTDQKPTHKSGSPSLVIQDNKEHVAQQIHEIEQDEKTVVEEEPGTSNSKVKSLQESDTTTEASIPTQIERQSKLENNNNDVISSLSSKDTTQERKSDHQRLENERLLPLLIVPKHRLKVKRRNQKGRNTVGQDYQQVTEYTRESSRSKHKHISSSASSKKSKDQSQSFDSQQASHSKWKLALFNPPTPPAMATEEKAVSRKRKYSESEAESDACSYSSSSSNSKNSSRSTSSSSTSSSASSKSSESLSYAQTRHIQHSLGHHIERAKKSRRSRHSRSHSQTYQSRRRKRRRFVDHGYYDPKRGRIGGVDRGGGFMEFNRNLAITFVAGYTVPFIFRLWGSLSG